MKKVTLLFLTVAFSYSLSAQITINYSDFTYDVTGDTFSFINIDTNNITLPQGGTDMVWDYSNLQYLNVGFSKIYEAVSDPNFPSSNVRTPEFVRYLDVSFPTYSYGTLDTTGFRINGNMDLSLEFPLVSATGNIADTLLVVGGPAIASNPKHFFKLPMAYNQEYVQTRVNTTNYIANVPTFNLMNFLIVGSIERRDSQIINGWGKLLMPNPNTIEVDTFEVLLQKTIITTEVYYYDANNNLLPAALLNPLNLAQGEKVTQTNYVFFTKNLNQYALSFIVFNGALDNITYHHKLFTDAPTVNTASIKVNRIAHAVYPNPIQNHQFQLEIDKNNSENWQLDIYNLMGQSVHNELIINNISTIQLNDNLPSGQYFYTIKNKTGEIIVNGKLMK